MGLPAKQLGGCIIPSRVRIPASPLFFMPLWLNWIERLLAEQKVTGSSPVGGTGCKCVDADH